MFFLYDIGYLPSFMRVVLLWKGDNVLIVNLGRKSRYSSYFALWIIKLAVKHVIRKVKDLYGAKLVHVGVVPFREDSKIVV